MFLILWKHNYLFQFTLYHILKGNKPDFHQAMGGDESKAFYEEFLKQVKASYKADMVKGITIKLYGEEFDIHFTLYISVLNC